MNIKIKQAGLAPEYFKDAEAFYRDEDGACVVIDRLGNEVSFPAPDDTTEGNEVIEVEVTQ